MRFSPLVPLSKFGRLVRALILVGMLLGNLFPDVGGVSIALISTVLAAPTILYEVGRWLPRVHPVFLFVIPVFGIVAFHALLVQPTSPYGQEKLEKWITTTLVAALAAILIRDKLAIVTFVRTWVFAGLILSALSVVGFQGGRADTFDSNPIWIGRAIGFAIVALVWMIWQRRIRWLWAVPSVAVLGAGLITTGSRGPLLAVAAGAVAMAIFSGRRKIAKVVAIVAAGGVAYWAVAYLPFFAESRFRTFISEGSVDLAREMLWRITIPVIQENPGGVGFGNWAAASGSPQQHVYPHNMPLEVFAEFGVIIGFLFLVAIAGVLVGLVRRSSTDPTTLLVLALLVGEIVAVNVSGDLNARTFFFTLTLGYLVSVRAVIPETTDAPADTEDRNKSLVRGSSRQAP